MLKSGQKCSTTVNSSQQRSLQSKTIKTLPKKIKNYQKKIKKGAQWSRILNNGQNHLKCLKMVKNGQQQSIQKNCQKRSKQKKTIKSMIKKQREKKV